MDIKERPNHKLYIQVLRQMSPEKRLLKAFELSDFARQLFIHGLRLEQTGIKYMITGSIVSSLQGEPRSTHDIDMVIAIQEPEVKGFIEAFSLDGQNSLVEVRSNSQMPSGFMKYSMRD